MLENNNTVSYIAFESQGARSERIIKRICAVFVVVITFLSIIILTLLCYIAQFDTVVETTTIEATQDAGVSGTNIIVGGDYAEAESEDNDNKALSQEKR